MWRDCFLWAMLLLYVLARICQLRADSLPTVLIVFLHVVPPALFAVVHGAALYRTKGIAVFASFCLGFGTLFESASLRTGFPFGNYRFTNVMGPKVFQLPVLLALAYLGIGYVAWIMGLLILGYVDKPIRGRAIVYLPLVASSIMTAWDVAMEPAWSTLDHAWIWSYGGAYFGVPVSNFLGWLLTSYCFYQAFALYCRGNPVQPASSHRRFWFSAVLIYAVCAMGNLLLLKMPMAPAIVEDATGKPWLTEDILTCCVIVSLLLMVPCALLAWLRARHASVVLIVGHSTFAE